MSTKAAGAKKGPSAPVRLYLVAYNLISAISWAAVVYTVFSSLFAGTKTQTLFGLFTVKPLSPTELYSKLNPLLHIIQSAAILEILHAIFKIVPSAWFTTLVQVASRLLVLWGYTSTTSFSHWSLYLLAASWSLVEVPRYLFYVWGLVTNNAPAPFPLFWLRYSLFAVLYPTGITGEILQIWNAIPYFKVVAPWARTLSYIILFGLYPPGGPFMYFHMVAMRKLQFKKRAEANKPASAAPQGLVFPTNPATGEISTTDTGRSAFAAATAAIDKAEGDKVLQERNWRFKYAPHVVKQVQLIAANPQAAIASSKAGLDFCYKNFQFVRGSYTGSLEAALKHFKTNRFFEASIKGTAPKPAEYELKVPYAGKTLTGDALKAQLAKWASYGTIEPSCRDAISWAASAKDKLDLSNQYFVLLGAGAAMGPLLVLLEHGANIIAIDLDRPQIWERLLTLAQKSTGKMYFPIKVDPKTLPANPSIQDYAKVAGCNLFTDTPEIATFVSDILPGKTLTIGGYAYLDSAAHVQVSLAMDAIMSEAGARRNTPVNLAFLCSPTDVFTVEKACYDAAKINHIKAPLWQKIIEKIMPKRLKKNCVAGKGPGGVDTFVNDGIVVDQGPNYALAKRIQHWRAMLSYTNGITVSTNIAPSTSTASVVSNASFKAAYGGMHLFKPMEVMHQETSNAVMGALLIHDILNTNCAKNPKSAAAVTNDPSLLFAKGAFHGGVWRIGYSMNSIGVFAALAFYLKQYAYVPPALVAGIAIVAKKGLPFELP